MIVVKNTKMRTYDYSIKYQNEKSNKLISHLHLFDKSDSLDSRNLPLSQNS